MLGAEPAGGEGALRYSVHGGAEAVVGPRDSGHSRSTTVPSGQLNLKLISCYRP
jgi:hypothetical protein